jgi:Rha family phage regulatory protein
MEALVWTTPKGTEVTDSRRIAKGFARQHGHVLRLIDELIVELNAAQEFSENGTSGLPGEFSAQELFHERKWVDNSNRTQREYVVRYEGFQLVVVRMSGPRALKFQVAFLLEFKRLQAENRRLKAELAARQPGTLLPESPEEALVRLLPYTQRNTQLECSKLVAARLMGGTGNANPVIEHYRLTFKLVTGVRPSTYVRQKVKENHKVQSGGGRAALRKLDPTKACVLAMLDEQVIKYGRTVKELAEVDLPAALEPAFAALLKLGLGQHQLEVGAAAPKKKLAN